MRVRVRVWVGVRARARARARLTLPPPGARGGQGGASAVVPFKSKGPWRSALNAVHGKASREYDPTELKVYLADISPSSPLYLPCISPISRLYLA